MAQFILGIVVVIFLIGIADVTFVDPAEYDVPERVISVAAVILSGVTIGLILAALRNGRHSTPDDPDDPASNRSRQTARQSLEQEDHHE